ncbi:MAG: hypothetical protein QNJ72_24340 [Pleurocapsa sp. MO_226.B13]|nr:hypothetical protein [Pleurocapsa sp. MO_226.B13]
MNQAINPLDTPESIADLADMLTYIEDAEGLALLLEVPEFTRQRLNRACRLLSPQRQQLIRQWAIENQQARLLSINSFKNE